MEGLPFVLACLCVLDRRGRGRALLRGNALKWRKALGVFEILRRQGKEK